MKKWLTGVSPQMVRQAYQPGLLCGASEKDTLNGPKSCSVERYFATNLLMSLVKDHDNKSYFVEKDQFLPNLNVEIGKPMVKLATLILGSNGPTSC